MVAMNHIVALSGGKDSVAMAFALKDREPREYQYVYTPTGWELPPMEAHFKMLEERLGSPLITLPTTTMDELIDIKKCLPNFQKRFCTPNIKIKPFERYIRANIPCTVYIGIRADESGDREGVDYDRIEGVTRRFFLDELGWVLQDVLGYVDCLGIVIPERSDCDACFFQTLYEWYLFWLNYRDRWMLREATEIRYGHTFRSPQRDTWPASMKGLRLRFEAGDVPKDRRTKRDAMCAVCAR